MKRILKIILSSVLIALLCAGCMASDAEPVTDETIELVQLEDIKEGQPIAIVNTSYGEIRFVLYEEYAPNTVENFKELVKSGFYDDTLIWGVEQGNVFAGATDKTGSKGEILTGDTDGIEPEINYNLWHFTGAVSAYGERDGVYTKKVLSDSRFFFVSYIEPDENVSAKLEENDYPQKVIDAYNDVGGSPLASGNFTVFGQVYEGMDVVNKIAEAEIISDTIAPKEDIRIKNITLSTYSLDE